MTEEENNCKTYALVHRPGLQRSEGVGEPIGPEEATKPAVQTGPDRSMTFHAGPHQTLAD